MEGRAAWESTHFSDEGATQIAELVAIELKKTSLGIAKFVR